MAGWWQPSKIESFMEELPVEKFFGVGKVTAQKMKNMGLHVGADLKRLSEDELVKHFGKSGRFFYKIVRGIDDREVQSHRETKSVGAEDTFPYDLETLDEMVVELEKIAATLQRRLEKYQLKGRTITLKIKYSDFKQVTRSHSLDSATNDIGIILATVKDLLTATEMEDVKIRLLGISVSNFGELAIRLNKEGEDQQLKLF